MYLRRRTSLEKGEIRVIQEGALLTISPSNLRLLESDSQSHIHK